MSFAKIPRHTRQNAITEGDLECILTRNCEDTEQLRNDSYFLPSSQKATALAAATLRESTPCDIGILTV